MWLRLGLGQWLPELGGNFQEGARFKGQLYTRGQKRSFRQYLWNTCCVWSVRVCVGGGDRQKLNKQFY